MFIKLPMPCHVKRDMFVYTCLLDIFVFARCMVQMAQFFQRQTFLYRRNGRNPVEEVHKILLDFLVPISEKQS